MPSFQNTHFGTVPYQPDAIIEFPCGLPGFEECCAFLPLPFAGGHDF
jgi:flagellar assembly factor FliW